MKRAVFIFSLLKNKYLLSVSVFVILMLFFDRNDVFTQMERKRQLKELQASKQFYVEEIEKTRKELAELQNNPAALEKYARENYYMKRDNEDVYIVESADTKKK